jgi:hypothetical protein
MNKALNKAMILAQVQALTSFIVRNPRYPTIGDIQLYIHRLLVEHDKLP